MPEKPQITTGSDNRTPTTMEQQGDSNWAQATFSRDGYHETIGATTDDAQTDPAQDATLMEVQKGALTQLNASLAQLGSILSALQGTLAVNVGNFPATQVVSVSQGNVGITGRNLTAAPVHGAKTVTTTAASLFAGVARLAGRNYLAVYNESSNTIYVGGSGVTTANGFPILPGETRVFSIDPASDFGIYAIASASSAVRVEEGK